MSKQAVIDSNVLVALVDSRDTWHSNAWALLTALKAEEVSLVYFDCVLNETISVLARRAEEQKRSDQLPSLLDKLSQHVPKHMVTWISSETQRLYDELVGLVRQTLGGLNFHDALIALCCRELDIDVIVSFDEDFDRAGWLTRVANPGEVSGCFHSDKG